MGAQMRAHHGGGRPADSRQQADPRDQSAAPAGPRMLDEESDEDRFADLARRSFRTGPLAEGGQLEDPAAYVERLNRCCCSSARPPDLRGAIVDCAAVRPRAACSRVIVWPMPATLLPRAFVLLIRCSSVPGALACFRSRRLRLPGVAGAAGTARTSRPWLSAGSVPRIDDRCDVRYHLVGLGAIQKVRGANGRRVTVSGLSG
jgi:hypothetical protein